MKLVYFFPKLIIGVARLIFGFSLMLPSSIIAAPVIFGWNLWHNLTKKECLNHWSVQPLRLSMHIMGAPYSEHCF